MAFWTIFSVFCATFHHQTQFIAPKEWDRKTKRYSQSFEHKTEYGQLATIYILNETDVYLS